MERRRTPPSLQDIALQVVIRRYVTVTRVLELMRFFKQIDWMIEQGPRLKGECTSFLKRTYCTMKLKHSKQEMEDILGNDFMVKLEKEAKDIETGFHKVKIVGRVLERNKGMPIRSTSVPPRSISVPTLSRSVSGKKAYPYNQLQTGLEWPNDVDASSREEYLADREFQDIFQVPYDVYRNYPKWKKIQLKKENLLF